MRNNLWVGSGISKMGEIPMLGMRAKGLANAVKKLMNGSVGIWLDPNDLTEEKIKWRRNLLTETEFRNGITDTLLRGGDITQASFAGLTLNTGLHLKRSGAVGYAYKAASSTVNATNVFSCFVRMPNGRAPVVGTNVDVNVDLSIVISGAVLPTAQVIDMGGGLYRVYGTRFATIEGATVGVAKYGSHSTDDVLISGYQYERGETPSPYQPITDFNSDFLRQFPLHALYQDAAGTIPVSAQGQPVGLMLDKGKPLVTGVAYLVTADLDFMTGWTNTPTVTSKSINSFTTNGGGGCFKSLPGVVGKTVKLRIKGQCTVSCTIRNGGNTDGSFVLPVGKFDITSNNPLIFIAASSLYFYLNGAGTLTIESITVEELKGNHAYQGVSASRPILQQTPILSNELVVNGDFSNGLTGWFNTNNWWSSVSGRAYHPLSSIYYELKQNIPNAVGKLVEVTFDIEVLQGTAVVGVSGDTNITKMFGVGKASYKFTQTLNAASYFFAARASGVNSEFYIDNVSIKEVTGYRTDQNYLAFDGVDDFLQTNNIDFTATDKLSLFAGVRKLSETTGVLTELSATADGNPNSFYLAAPLAGSSSFRFYSKAASSTTAVAVPTDVAKSPISCVVTVKSAMVNGGDVTLKVNQQSYSTKNTTAIGNYGNYPLYIGRRGGTSLPFNGNIYSLIIVGRLTADNETKHIESEIAKVTGVTLNV